MNDHINFFENNNGKLFNDAFSTIRLKDNKFQIGQTYDIKYHGNWCGDAEIVYTKDFYLHQLNDAMAYLDTGQSIRETIELLKTYYEWQTTAIENTLFTYIVLRRITKDTSLKVPINELYQRAASPTPI